MGAIMVMLSIGFSGCKEEENAPFDIDWPVPEVTSITPAEQMIGEEITIKGNYFDKRVTEILVGGAKVDKDKFVSVSATEIVVVVPRTVAAGPVEVRNIYDKFGMSEGDFIPKYPATSVTSFPSEIERGSSFSIQGVNVDLITKIQLGSTTIDIDGTTGSATSISVQTGAADLSGESVAITILAAKGGLEGTITQSAIPIVDAGAFFDAKPPIVLWDFEDGVNPYSGEGNSSLNGGTIVGGRGDNYLHIDGSNPDQWHTYGLITATEVNPVAEGFSDPHISFLVNTGDAEGYFHMMIEQGGETIEAHFNNDPDDYKFNTEGEWQWRSYTLDPSSSESGEFKSAFDPNQAFTMQLQIRNGNIGSGDFEINFDQVMITDGPVNPVQTLFDFEDGVNPYSGSASSGINLSGIPTVRGDKYLTVMESGAFGSFTWTGDMASGGVDLANVERPFISFWVNTNGNNGNFQVEITQSGVKWGSDPFKDAPDGGYTIKTDGWELYTFELIALMTSVWDGDGSAGFSTNDALDYVKLGFSTGNQETGVYEVNIDQVTISDGPLF